jgi:hypothetical protein
MLDILMRGVSIHQNIWLYANNGLYADRLSSLHPVCLFCSGEGLADLLVRATGIIELLAKFVSFAVVVGFSKCNSSWCLV